MEVIPDLSKSISPKVNTKEWQKFIHANYDFAVWTWTITPEKALFTVAAFFLRKSIMMGAFKCRKIIIMTFFTDRCARNIFFIGESLFSL